jgi:hypothetical protein
MSDTQSIIQRTFPNVTIARRKGVRVRLFDAARAKMGPWILDPIAERERDMRQQHESAQRYDAKHLRAGLEAMTVAELRRMALRLYGANMPSRYRKGDIVAYIITTQEA